MRSRVLLPAALIALVVSAPLLAACGDDDQGVIDAGPTPTSSADVVAPPPDGEAPDGGGDPLFTDFVKGLIANETKANNFPTTVNDKKFAPDPQDPKAFPPSFF